MQEGLYQPSSYLELSEVLATKLIANSLSNDNYLVPNSIELVTGIFLVLDLVSWLSFVSSALDIQREQTECTSEGSWSV